MRCERFVVDGAFRAEAAVIAGRARHQLKLDLTDDALEFQLRFPSKLPLERAFRRE